MAISNTVKLALYNRALLILGSRQLSSLSENREPRRDLDRAWGSADEIVDLALEEADWNFATKAVEAVVSTSVTPHFGFNYAYTKPTDLKRLTTLSASGVFSSSLLARDYSDEAGYWYTNVTPLYARYVSNHADYGFDAARWTGSFKEYLAADLAEKVAYKITNDTQDIQRCMMLRDDAKKGAKSHDAMDEGVKMLPTGTWVRARSSNRSGEYGR